MIDIGKYKNVLDQGLLLDHYSLLCCIRDGSELPQSKRITGFINLLHKKGYLKDGMLTELATALVDNDTVVCQTVMKLPTESEQPKVQQETDYLVWARALHKKLQDRLVERTGKRQVRGNVNGSTYCFLPNANDLSKVLLKVILLHKLKDFDKIEAHLLNYIDRKARENYWFPILNYHIMKNGMSAMVTEMEGNEEENNGTNPSIHIV